MAFRAVAAFGLGTGRRPPRAAAALAAPDLAVPFWVGHGSEVPAFVGADTLVFAVSSSGGTAETLGAAAEAVARGATVVAVGGQAAGALARLADEAGLAVVPGIRRRRAPRAALGATTVPLLVALARAGLWPDCTAAVTAAVGGPRPTARHPGGTRAPRRRNWRAGWGAPSPSSTAPPAWPPWPPAGGRRR